MANQQKKDYVAQLSNKLQDYPHFVLVNFKGTSHQQLEDFRATLREINDNADEWSRFTAIKNSLFKIAFSQINQKSKAVSKDEEESIHDQTKGQSGLLLLKGDWLAGLKAFHTFAKTQEDAGFRIGFIDGKVYQEQGLVQLSNLPSQDQLVAQIIRALRAPQSRLVYSMQYSAMKLVHVLRNAKKEN